MSNLSKYNYFTARFKTAGGQSGLVSSLIISDDRGYLPITAMKEHIRHKLPKTVVADDEKFSFHIIERFEVATNEVSMGQLPTEITLFETQGDTLG